MGDARAPTLFIYPRRFINDAPPYAYLTMRVIFKEDDFQVKSWIKGSRLTSSGKLDAYLSAGRPIFVAINSMTGTRLLAICLCVGIPDQSAPESLSSGEGCILSCCLGIPFALA